MRLDAALRCAKMGAGIFPLRWPTVDENGVVHCACRGIPSCNGGKNAGKHPIAQLAPRGFRDASHDLQQIAAWWRRYPDANIGFVPASLGLVAADIDKPEHRVDAIRFGLFAEPTYEVFTGNGMHLYFSVSSPSPRDVMLGTVIIRGAHGYTLQPPSQHANGKFYQRRGSLDDVKPLPALAVAACLQASRIEGGKQRVEQVFASEQIGEGGRHAALCTMVGHLVGRDIDQRYALDLAYGWNLQHCVPSLGAPEVKRVVGDLYAKSRVRGIPEIPVLGPKGSSTGSRTTNSHSARA